MNREIQDAVEKLRAAARSGFDEKSADVKLDNFFYNWCLAFAILLNMFATVVPETWGTNWIFAGRVASGLATAWFAIDRALQFGPRWQFGMAQRSAFRSILIYLDILPIMADTKTQIKELKDIREWLEYLFAQEAKIPGIGTSADGTPKPDA